jgi:hypothetical protein
MILRDFTPSATRYYLGIEVQAEPAIDGWAWATWPNGKRFRHWAAQLRITPWGQLGVIDAEGKLAERGSISWSETIGGGKTWRGLEPGDQIYIDDRLVFVADNPAARMTAG